MMGGTEKFKLGEEVEVKHEGRNGREKTTFGRIAGRGDRPGLWKVILSSLTPPLTVQFEEDDIVSVEERNR